MKTASTAAVALALVAALPASAQRVADFAQIDASSSSTTAVVVRALGDPRAAAPAPLLTATFSRWRDGEAGGVGVVWRHGVGAADQRLTLGAGVGANGFRSRAPADDEQETAMSLRAQADLSGRALGGTYYALLQASTFRRSGFATLQFAPSALPVAFELSRYAERSYGATTLMLRLALGGGWSLRAGAVDDGRGTRGVVGIGYNGF